EAALYARQLGVWYEEETASLLVLEPEAAAELPGALEREVLGTAWGQLQREFQNRLFVALRGAGEEGAATMTTDERLARWALLAGDAGLTRFLYVLQNPQPMDPNELPSTDPDHPYNAIPLPQLMRDLHFFPFNEGFELVQSLHSLGGFLQVDAAYSRPPESCRAVLDTEVYLNAHSLPPVRIELPLPSGGERPHTDDRLGPYVIRMALLKANEAEKAGMASVGWIGDRLLAFPAEVGEAGRSDAVWQTRWLEPDFAQAFFRAAGELIQHTYQAKAEIREGELKLKAAGRRVTLKIHEGGRAVTWLDTDAGAARSQALHEHYIGVTSETP
ncbi:MAG: hypothetical protein KDK99_20315, partial [Verrucomicrobiales bacterium]|nr:hypothetical protein [Verrucomicrobiales bacterium]